MCGNDWIVYNFEKNYKIMSFHIFIKKHQTNWHDTIFKWQSALFITPLGQVNASGKLIVDHLYDIQTSHYLAYVQINK